MSQPNITKSNLFTLLRWFSLFALIGLIGLLFWAGEQENNEINPKVIRFEDYPSNLNANKVVWSSSHAGRQNLSDFNGQILIISFWAQWCSPCLLELPLLEDLARQLNSLPLRVILINKDKPEDVSKAEQLIKILNINSASVVFNSKLADELNVQLLPAHLIINKNGGIVSEIYGIINWTHPKVIKQLTDLANHPTSDPQ